MINPLIRFLTWLWDSKGEQRHQQEERLSDTDIVISHNAKARALALDEVRRTQVFISDRLGK